MNEIVEMENTIANYYSFTKENKPENFQNIIRFNEIDLENYLAENGNLNIVFEKLLEEQN